MHIGDGNIVAGLSELVASQPDKFKSMGEATASVPFATIFTGMMLVQIFYWGTNQAIIQRALGAKNLKEGQKGLFLAAFIKILGPLIVVLPGVIAFHIFNGDVGNADQAYPKLVNTVLPTYLLGFFAAVLFGAILSSFNSALNSSVTLFGVDIYKTYLKKDATEKQVVKAGKSFGVLLAVLAMFVAPFIANASSGLFDYLQEVNGCYSIPILTIIVVGYLTKYVPAIAAKIGLLSGVILYSISQFILKPYIINNKLADAQASGASPDLLDVIEKTTYPHFLHVMAILFVLNISIMLAIGKLYPRKEAFAQKYTHQVDIKPWKWVTPVAIGIAVIVVGIYIYFA
jgi:SSS family solute:Na+ symporter